MFQSSLHIIMISLGFIFAVVGIVLFVKQYGRNEENEIKFMNTSIKSSNSAIIIFVVGAALMTMG